jgi:hypothetical protein
VIFFCANIYPNSFACSQNNGLLPAFEPQKTAREVIAIFLFILNKIQIKIIEIQKHFQQSHHEKTKKNILWLRE